MCQALPWDWPTHSEVELDPHSFQWFTFFPAMLTQSFQSWDRGDVGLARTFWAQGLLPMVCGALAHGDKLVRPWGPPGASWPDWCCGGTRW